jgi:hypothetical protein
MSDDTNSSATTRAPAMHDAYDPRLSSVIDVVSGLAIASPAADALHERRSDSHATAHPPSSSSTYDSKLHPTMQDQTGRHELDEFKQSNLHSTTSSADDDAAAAPLRVDSPRAAFGPPHLPTSTSAAGGLTSARSSPDSSAAAVRADGASMLSAAAVDGSTVSVDARPHAGDEHQFESSQPLPTSKTPHTSPVARTQPPHPSASAAKTAEEHKQSESTSNSAATVTVGGPHLRPVSASVRTYLLAHIEPIRSFLRLRRLQLQSERDARHASDMGQLAGYEAHLTGLPDPAVTFADVANRALLAGMISMTHRAMADTKKLLRLNLRPYVRSAALVDQFLEQAAGHADGPSSCSDACTAAQMLFTMDCTSRFEHVTLTNHNHSIGPEILTAYRQMMVVIEGAMSLYVREIPSAAVAESVLGKLFEVRAYHLVTELMHRFGVPLNQRCYSEFRRIVRSSYCFVDSSPMLSFLSFGLDPSWIHSSESPDVKSALELARQYARHYPAATDGATVTPHAVSRCTTVESAEDQLQADPPPHPLNMVHAFATQLPLADRDAELRRMRDNQVAFNRNLLTAWSRHSHAIRERLMQASPSKLIPPLVDIVAEYLDLDSIHPAGVKSNH